MEYKRFEDDVIVKLDDGDSIHECIRKICEKEQIKLGSIEGFGGIAYLKAGIWNNQSDAYDYLEVSDRSMEIVSLIGNITMLNDEPFTHIHVVVTDNTFKTFGGHLVDGIVKNLAELVIHKTDGRINRKKQGKWYVMDFE